MNIMNNLTMYWEIQGLPKYGIHYFYYLGSKTDCAFLHQQSMFGSQTRKIPIIFNWKKSFPTDTKASIISHRFVILMGLVLFWNGLIHLSIRISLFASGTDIFQRVYPPCKHCRPWSDWFVFTDKDNSWQKLKHSVTVVE